MILDGETIGGASVIAVEDKFKRSVGAAIVFWEKLRRFRPLSEMAGNLENMFRCKKDSWQADLRSWRRKFVFRLVAMEILFAQEKYRNQSAFTES